MKTSFIVIAIIAVITAFNSFFVVSQTEQAIVLQFGEAKKVIQEPGLYVKTPFIQSVVKYDNRILSLDPKAKEMILMDKKRIVVDSLCRFRIEDPLKFYQSLGSYSFAKTRLHDAVESSLRDVLGLSTMTDILSSKREDIMQKAKNSANEKVDEYGVEILDVRLRSTDLPAETSNAIFARMKSEREREAQEIRATGQAISQEIKAKADKERTVILSSAQKDSESIRGQGEQTSLKLWGDAAKQNPDFFAFYKSLSAYKNAIINEDYLVLSPNSEFFEYFNKSVKPK